MQFAFASVTTGRERTPTRASRARCVLERHSGAVPIGDCLHDGEAEVRYPFRGTRPAIEPIKPVRDPRPYSRAGVRHLEHRPALRLLRRSHVHAAAGGV